MPRKRRKRQFQRPKAEYLTPAAIKVNTEAGRGLLWSQRIERAKRLLEIEEREKVRKETLGYIDGTYAKQARETRVYLNEALPALEDLILGTLPSLPPVQVEPRELHHEDLAKMVAALLDQTLDSGLCRALPAMIRAEWDEIGWGIGFLKTAWHVEDRPSNLRIPTDEAYMSPHVQLAMFENSDPARAQVAENDDDAVHLVVHGDRPELAEHVAEHQERLGRLRIAHPVIRRVSPDRMFYDPDAVDEWLERDWEAEYCTELVSSLQRIPGIKNLTPENCPSVDEFDLDNPEDSNAVNNSFDFEKTHVGVYHIHDRANHTYMILPATNNVVKPVLEADWPYGALDIYYPIVHRPSGETIHGRETLGLIKPILDELARTNAAIRKHNRRAANAKVLLAAMSRDPKFERELESEQGHIAHYRPGGEPREFKPNGAPPEVLKHRDMLLSELRRMLGSDIMTQGGDTPHQISATEAQWRGSFQGDRLGRRKQQISDALSWLGRNIAMLYRDWGRESISVKVMGLEGLEVRQLDPSSIPEDLMVKLDIEATMEAKQAADMQAALVLVDKAIAIAPDVMDPAELVRLLFDRAGIRNPDKYFANKDEPVLRIAPQEGAGGTAPLPAERSRSGPMQGQKGGPQTQGQVG